MGMDSVVSCSWLGEVKDPVTELEDGTEVEVEDGTVDMMDFQDRFGNLTVLGSALGWRGAVGHQHSLGEERLRHRA